MKERFVNLRSFRVRLVRGTGRDGTGRGVPSRVWCAKNGWNGLFHGTDFGCFCVPPPTPGTGLFHVCGTQCFTILRQIYPMSFSKITPSFRPVPSAYQTHPYLTTNFGTVISTSQISFYTPHKCIFLSNYRKFGVQNEIFGIPITIS
ncbi:hypothetical protein DVH24_007882 [Malus domestica]|uniref:Uncharacterized protein n=1 Tax=Malus domestica TaxID=3750 RepID=A0A498JR74_MALDO|nr:hypothetical protein DVH24_007882 [Malus domestica]